MNVNHNVNISEVQWTKERERQVVRATRQIYRSRETESKWMEETELTGVCRHECR